MVLWMIVTLFLYIYILYCIAYTETHAKAYHIVSIRMLLSQCFVNVKWSKRMALTKKNCRAFAYKTNKYSIYRRSIDSKVILNKSHRCKIDKS